MKNFICFIVITVALLNTHCLIAQELQCKVNVRAEQVESTKRQIFRILEKDIQEFMNGQTWTDKNFKPEERINCDLVISINKRNDDNFQAQASIKSSRPVYGSDYNTNILNTRDKEFNFKYRENQKLNYIEGSFGSNLSSLLAYYAYIIIGFDFDTFSEKGGTPYFQKAENIVSTAQSSSFKGWKSTGKDDNRYDFINQIMGTRFEKFRVALYKYHRKGLDVMHEDAKKGRLTIFESLKTLEQVHQAEPNSYLVNQFFEAKSNEIGKVFSKGEKNVKNQVFGLLEKLDPSNLSYYKKTIRQ